MSKLTKVTDVDPRAVLAEQEPTYERRLEIYDPRKNANKFWHIYVIGRFIVRHWGRHGTKGQWSIHSVPEWQARGAAADLAGQKYRKGYKDEVGVLDRVARELG